VFLYVTGALIVLSLVLLLGFAVYLTNVRRKFAHIPSPPMARYTYGLNVYIIRSA